MNRYMKIALGAILPVALLGGCSDWLTGNKLTTNPNFPTSASRDQLLTGIMVGQTIIQTGDLARLFSMWTQQMAGVDRQYTLYGTYVYDEDAFSADWAQIYTGGGLIDERSLQQNALQAGDTLYAGIGMVWEALTVGTAADIWGDIPYSQAVSDVLRPKLDAQQDVYNAIQAKLDTAIAYLHCKAPTCVGPLGVDLIYGGNDTAWIELAHTLKARYYMHVAPRLGNAAYDSALIHADSGISTPAHDFNSYQSGNSNEWNLWYQFIVVQRAGYMAAGANLVNLLRNTNDPRLTKYYGPTSAGQIVGANPGQSGTFSTLSSTRLAPSFRQPMVTFAENQLIRAEAALRLGQTGTAVAAYNAERTSQGVSTTGSVTLEQILTEKYIALFQQIEPWNDYKRTCIPALTPAAGTAGIPRRLLYPLSAERNQNPNIPPPSQQPVANWNDPTGHC
jgi:hypothetical protein